MDLDALILVSTASERDNVVARKNGQQDKKKMTSEGMVSESMTSLSPVGLRQGEVVEVVRLMEGLSAMADHTTIGTDEEA